MLESTTHRPRNVGWARAAALLYGDWGTSKAYVIGLAFVAAGFSSFPIILAVCVLTAVVAYNYIIICRHFPDGGGVYSAAREQSRVLAVLGSLLLLADFIVTAAMSCWDAMIYLNVPQGLAIFKTWLVSVTTGVAYQSLTVPAGDALVLISEICDHRFYHSGRTIKLFWPQTFRQFCRHFGDPDGCGGGLNCCR